MGKLTRISRRNIILIIGVLVAIFIGISALLMKNRSDDRTSRQSIDSPPAGVLSPQTGNQLSSAYNAIMDWIRIQ